MMRTVAELDALITEELDRFAVLQDAHKKTMGDFYAERFLSIVFEEVGQAGLDLLHDFPFRAPLLTIPEFWETQEPFPRWWPKWGTLFEVYVQVTDTLDQTISLCEHESPPEQKRFAVVPVELARKMRQAWIEANPIVRT